MDFLGALAIALGMAIDENRLRAHLGRGAQRHGGMHAEFARLVGGGGDHAALVALSADDDGFAFQRGSKSSSTETKKASMSTWKMVLGKACT